ncbi:small multidrug efflux protein [Microbacterium sp.]|uniref:small multidrug efflux protein n=1 Tax=Microbacterium sp. TaxID=51671 RepID=UPI003F6EF713
MSSNPYEGIRDLIGGLPEIVQPLLVAGLGMVPYVEGEGSTVIGILVGINPVAAAVAGASGNILSVVLVVLLSAQVRTAIVARRMTSAAGGEYTGADTSSPGEKTTRRSKGRARLAEWSTRFGVPGASILAPFVLPTQLTAAFFVAAGVGKGWVILWQVVAIVLWTGLIAAAALGFLSVIGWA